MRITNPWKTAFYITLVVLIGSYVFFLFSVIDNGTTSTYMNVGYEDAKKDRDVLACLVAEFGKNINRTELVYLLRKYSPDALITDNEEGVGIGQLKFRFEGDGLAGIDYQ